MSNLADALQNSRPAQAIRDIIAAVGYESGFSKNTAFNKNFGTGNSDVMRGDAIESGSNANGNWTKFPDGTLIQQGFAAQQTAFASSGNIYQSATGKKFTFSVEFLATPFISAEAMGATGMWCGIRMASSSDFEIVDFQPYSTDSNISRSWFALGRWK